MVEFVFSGLLFLFILIAGVEATRYVYTVHLVQHTLNELSRAMIMGRLPKDNHCHQGPINQQCRAKSIGYFFRSTANGLGLKLHDGIRLNVCENVSTDSDVQNCRACINAGGAFCSCRPMVNTDCLGLKPGDENAAGRKAFVEIYYPIDLVFKIIQFPIRAGVIVKNEPFQD